MLKSKSRHLIINHEYAAKNEKSVEPKKSEDADSWNSNEDSEDEFIKGLTKNKKLFGTRLTKNGKVISKYDLQNGDALNHNNKYLHLFKKFSNKNKYKSTQKARFDQQFENILKHDHVSALNQLNRTMDESLKMLALATGCSEEESQEYSLNTKMEKERRINNINTENKYVIKISNMNQKLNFKKKVKLNKKMLHPEFNFSSIESSTKKRKTYQPAYISSNQSNILEGSECSSNYDTNTPMYKLKKMNVRKLSNNSISLLSDQKKSEAMSVKVYDGSYSWSFLDEKSRSPSSIQSKCKMIRLVRKNSVEIFKTPLPLLKNNNNTSNYEINHCQSDLSNKNVKNSNSSYMSVMRTRSSSVSKLKQHSSSIFPSINY